MNVIKMHYSNPIAWIFMPQLLDRARKFSEKYGMDFTPDLMEEAIRIHFVAKNPTVVCWIAVDKHVVVGHIITSIDTLTGYDGQVVKRYMTILQAESDVQTDVFRSEVMAEIQGWARENYCDSIQLLCEEEWRERLFSKYGFRKKKTVMTMEVN